MLAGVQITRAFYSLAVEDGSFPRHHMLPLEQSAPTVTVVTDVPTTAVVTVQVSQETVDVDFAPGMRSVGGEGGAQRHPTAPDSTTRLRNGVRRSAADRVREEQRRSFQRLADLH